MRYHRDVPYREDEDAVLARADALQNDLDRAQAELASTRSRLADAERARDQAELASTRSRLADAERARDQLIVERDAHAGGHRLIEMTRIPARWDFRRNVLPLILTAFGAVLLIILVFTAQAARKAEQNEYDRAFRDSLGHAGFATPIMCTIHTVPEGAVLVMIGPDHEVRSFGKTPRSYPHGPGDGVVEARLDGYAPVTVVAEPDASGACSMTYTLHAQ